MKSLFAFIKESNNMNDQKLLNAVKETVKNANKDYEVRMANENDVVEKKSKGSVVVVVKGDVKEHAEAKSILKNFKFTTYGAANTEYYFINKCITESAEDGKNGHWSEFVDEDTGELVTMWVDDKPEEIVKAVKEATPEELQKLRDLRKAFDKLDDKWYETSDELVDNKHELRSLKDQLRELQYDMEEEIGHAKDDAEADELGNEYGEQLEELQEKIRQTIKNIETLTKKKDELREKVDDASNKLWEYEQKIGYHAHHGGKVSKL